jgi:excinuclease UvrABC ATPase subunit
MNKPVSSIPKEKLDLILYGTGDEEVTVKLNGRNDRQSTFRTSFEGCDTQPGTPLP